MKERPWATINPALPIPPPTHTLSNGMNGSDRGWASVNQASPLENGYRGSIDQGDTEDGIALIDTLPKNKQRQVYGLVSGLQGGIEHLQRELDSLKRALGIYE